MSNATHDAIKARPAKRAGEFQRSKGRGPTTLLKSEPVSDVLAIDRPGTLRIYLTVMPILGREKPRRVKLAEHRAVTEKQARDLFAAFEAYNSFEGKTAERCSAVWLPYPVHL